MKKTILLADDSLTIQRLVTQTFGNEEDFRVVSVSNGDAAVEKFGELRPTVVLADVFMPGRNGYEVCTFIKEHPVLDQTPVILLVGAFEVFDEEEAARVGSNGRITKPFEPQALYEMVSGVIEGAMVDAPGEPDVDDDILGLEELFPQINLAPERAPLSSEEIELIADRVIARLSSEVVEGVAWDVVPDIAEQIVRDEMKKHDEH